MAEIKIYGTLVNDTNEAIVKSTQVAAVKQDGTAATQSAVNADLYAKYAAIGNAYRVKGTKATIAEVTALTSKAIGDVWNVTAEFTLNSKKYPAGTNVVWTGSEWDPLGGTVDLAALEAKIPTNVIENITIDGSSSFVSISGKTADISLMNGSLPTDIRLWEGKFYLANEMQGPMFKTTVQFATQSVPGFMSSSDKLKLDYIAYGAQVNVLESVKVNGTALSVSGKSVNIDLSPYAKSADTIHVADVTASETNMNLKLRKKANDTPICNVVFNAATTSTAGLMSAADKTRLEASATAADLNAAKALITALTNRVAALEAALTLK